MTHFVGIDPSTKTGFVRIGLDGTVLVEKLITSEHTEDVKRLSDLVEQIVIELNHDDVICIESLSIASKGSFANQMCGLQYMLRSKILGMGMTYINAAPTQLKKFVTGHHQAKKEAFILPLFKNYGYENSDDNIRDAYGLAQIARSVRTGVFANKKQEEVVRKVLQSAKA